MERRSRPTRDDSEADSRPVVKSRSNDLGLRQQYFASLSHADAKHYSRLAFGRFVLALPISRPWNLRYVPPQRFVEIHFVDDYSVFDTM